MTIICLSDSTRLPVNTFTYSGDSGLRQSWLDHVISSVMIDSMHDLIDQHLS